MTSVGAWPARGWVIVGILATLLLAGLSLVTVGVLRGGFTAGGPGLSVGACAVPTLSGTVVNVNLTNMGGPMMGGGGGPMTGGGPIMMGGTMRLQADPATVPHGTVWFLATNRGSITHEMVVLPLPEAQIVGARPIGGDGKIDEMGSLGEASNNCAEGPGQGILPGGSSWVSITLKPGRYELLCNLPGHYGAGMYTQLTVT
ncbi:sulfocyanin-like copper-binding protein [Arthrobacter sp. E3]|uniref:sulfocyanin-like copper-binding protein n=1 Tax=Arthrobacter sp. E3 TaxID=517402 RepID=UPI001A951002|nr:sulfocyanin-like copper-binding protein [Arthrobacter sp. E3]